MKKDWIDSFRPLAYVLAGAAVVLTLASLVPGGRVLGPSQARADIGPLGAGAPPGFGPRKPLFLSQSNDQPPWIKTFGFSSAAFALTASGSGLAIEAGNNGLVRIKRICVGPGVATAGAGGIVQIFRYTGTASAGVAVTAVAFDPNYGGVNGGGFSGQVRAGTGATAVTTSGLSTNSVMGIPISIGQAGASPGQTQPCMAVDDGSFGPLIVPAGVGSGISFTFPGTAGGAGQSFSGIFTEEGTPQ